MYVKFFKRSTNSKGCIEYMYSDKDHKGEVRDVEPRTLQGDPELTQYYINKANDEFKHCYTAGVLSFAENDIPEQEKLSLMKSFEDALMPGMDAGQYNILWIEHRDKNRLELNFVIPKINTETEQSLRTYYAPVDQIRIDAWKDLCNIKYGYADPKEPKRQQTTTIPHNLPKSTKDIRQAIDGYLKECQPNDRDEIIELLEGIKSIEISRQTSKSISIKTDENTRPIRLTGGMYEQTYRRAETSRESIDRAQREFENTWEERAREARQRYDKHYKSARERNIEKYERYHRQKRAQKNLHSDASTARLCEHHHSERSDLHIEQGNTGREQGAIRENGSIKEESRNNLQKHNEEQSPSQSQSQGQDQNQDYKQRQDQQKQIKDKITRIYTDEFTIRGITELGKRESRFSNFAQETTRNKREQQLTHSQNYRKHDKLAEQIRHTSRDDKRVNQWCKRFGERAIERTRELKKQIKNKLDRAIKKVHSMTMSR